MTSPAEQSGETGGDDWFYQLVGLATGPVTRDRIVWLIEHQHLTANTLVGHTSSGPWNRLGESELQALLPSATPEAKDFNSLKRPVQVAGPQIPRRRQRRKAKSLGVGDDEILDGIEIDTENYEPAPEPPEEVATPEPVVPLEPEPVPASMADTHVESLAETQPAIQTAPVVMPFVEPQVAEPARSKRPSSNESNSPRAGAGPTGPARQNREPKTARQKYSQYAAIGLLALVCVSFLTSFFRGSANTAEAAQTFERVMSEFDASGTKSDMEFAKWIKQSREDVSTQLEPLREFASSDAPEVQTLMWAGDRLMIMLKGARTLPPGVRDRYEAYMAEYRGDPPAASKAVVSETEMASEGAPSQPEEPMDPIF